MLLTAGGLLLTFSFLWIVPKSPVPPIDGARVASYNLLKGILSEGAHVHLVILPPKDEAPLIDVPALKQELHVSNVTIRPRPQSGRGKLRWVFTAISWARSRHLPFTVSAFNTPAVAHVLDNMTETFRGTLVVYDGLHCAGHLFDRKKGIRRPTPYVLRAHNREAELWRRKALLSANWFERRLLSANAKAVARFEDTVVRSARAVATVSDFDRALFLAQLPDLASGRLATVPIGYEFGLPPPFPETDPWRLLFVGRLDWPPNREGLEWFLNAVWPYIIREAPRWSLTVAGSGDGRWLNRYKHLTGLHVCGLVDDLAALYSRNSLVILPLFFGSGTRVKAIEASRYGRPCMSTHVGVEGLGLSDGADYFCAETAEEWIRGLNRVTTADIRAKGENAWKRLRTTYDLRAAAASFLALASRAAVDHTR
jgi:glycosyltransferase involved in cell wall biosynthesis